MGAVAKGANGASRKAGAAGVVREISHAFFQLMMKRSDWFHAVATEMGLSPIQAHTLFRIDPERECMMSALANAAGFGPSNLTGIIDKLEARGLVVRRGAPGDRRIKMIAVTRAGTALRKRLVALLSEPAEWMLALSPRDQRQLCEILKAALTVDRRPKLLPARAARAEAHPS